MARKWTFFIAGAIVSAGAIFSVSQLVTRADAQTTETYRQLNLFGEAFERVLANYVDEITEERLIQAAITGMLQSLDPHSDYMVPAAYQDLTRTNRGEFGGLGIEVTMDENGFVEVVTPMADGPAERVGIIAGDLIIAVGDVAIQGLSLNQAVELMRGDPGTEVRITVAREGADGPIQFTIIREVIQMTSVRSSVFGTIGYIRLTSFTDNTTQGLQDAVIRLTSQIGADQVTGFILDLRNNPGGLLDQSVSVADAFLERGEILTTRGRYEEQTRRYASRAGDIIRGLPLIVLINGGAASASEIVAGALQDQRRATVVGTLSFGKGTVQTIIPLSANQGALRLTTARYYTPSGRSIQATGIAPDIRVAQILPPEIMEQLQLLPPQGEAALPGRLENPGEGVEEQAATYDLIPRDPLADTQLQFALALMRGEETNPAYPPNPNAGIPGAPAPATPAPTPAPVTPAPAPAP